MHATNKGRTNFHSFKDKLNQDNCVHEAHIKVRFEDLSPYNFLCSVSSIFLKLFIASLLIIFNFYCYMMDIHGI